MKIRNLVTVALFAALSLIAGTSSAYVIDGSVADWGVNLGATNGWAVSYLDHALPSGGNDIDYITEDNTDRNGGFAYVGPGYSQGNQYDVEAMYFDNDVTRGYITIISGIAPTETTFPGGDIGLDVVAGGDHGYEAGIRLSDGQLMSVSSWTDVDYTQHGVSNPWKINTGSAIGTGSSLVYSTTAVNDHYVIEASFLLADLGLQDGGNLTIHWTMKCGNDYLNLNADVNPVPEPATMLLLGTGLIGLAGFGKRRFLRS